MKINIFKLCIGWLGLSLLFFIWLNIDKPIQAHAEEVIEVTSERVKMNGIVYWWQEDNGSFRAGNALDSISAPMIGPVNDPRPASTTIRARFDLRNYAMPSTFRDAKGNTYSASEVSNIQALDPEWDPQYNGTTYKGVSKNIVNNYFLEVSVTTGGILQANNVEEYGKSPSGNPKFNVDYLVPMYIKWKGVIKKDGETDPDPDPGGGGEQPPTDPCAGGACDDPMPPLNPGGSGGSCSVDFEPGGTGSILDQNITTATPSGNISSDNGQFDVLQGIPSSEYLRTTAQSEEYLVDQSFVQQLGNTVFGGISVSKTFVLSWTDPPKVPGGSPIKRYSTETVEYTINDITRPYSYWEISRYTIHQLISATMNNYALPNGSITMPSGLNIEASGNHSSDVRDHVFPPSCPGWIELPGELIEGKTAPSSIADEANSAAESEIGENEVQNDYASFKNTTIMDDSRTSVEGPTPSSVPSPSKVTLQKGGHLIDPLKTNYYQAPSSGSVLYTPIVNINGNGSNLTFYFGVNHVTVHTPTVIYAKASDDKEHDQRTNPPLRSTPADPDKDRHAFILDRPFTVTLPTTGQHRNIPGYGNRDFKKYIKEKQVRFPFDVYSETKQAFYPANTWISVPVDIDSVNFFLPVWVPEGEYTVDFRAFAINAPTTGNNGGSEPEANITIPNGVVEGHPSAAHVATDSIEVDVVGRLYDFHVTDITDFNWQSVFRELDGVTHTGNTYWVGQNDIDGNLRGNSELFTLPIRQGSHTEGYKNVATKIGYTFRFDMKTKGNMFGNTDGIRITPTFYFVTKDGKNRQEVDLYYHNKEDLFVRIGSAEDTVYREVQLNNPLRNVPATEIGANADYYYRHATEYGLEDTVANYFPASFARQYSKHISKEDITTGPYSWQILNWNLRTFRGPEEFEVPSKTMIPAEDIVAREQTWYGEYSLPSDVYVVAKDTSIAYEGMMERLNESHPIFLRDGYIVVNFNIESIRNGDLENPYLQYINGKYMNQWYDMEGFKRSFVDPYGHTFNLLDGDVIFYHGDKSYMDDYSPSVTH